VNVRRRIDKLRVLAAARGAESGPGVWVVIPANGRGDSPDPDTPVVNGPVVVVPRHWTPDQTDAFLARLSAGRPDKVVLGIDYDRL
jgi:hypothetical protein